MKSISFNIPEEEVKPRTLALDKNYLKIAALFPKYSFKDLNNVLNFQKATDLSEEDKKNLVRCSYKSDSTEYTINDHERNRILRTMRFEEINNINHLISSVRSNKSQELLQAYIDKNAPGLTEQTVPQLLATYNFSKWFNETAVEIPKESEVLSELRRREILEPLERLTSYFQGRTHELVKLNDYVNWLPPSSFFKRIENFTRSILSSDQRPPLLITGIGGIGKSTLISKFILNHVKEGFGKLPFVYIDFDRPGISLSDPVFLAIEALKQLSAQFLNQKGKFEEIQKYLREGYLDNNINNNQSRGSDRYLFYKEFLIRYEKELSSLTTPILVVFDSFEEIQYRAPLSEINSLFDFLNEVSQLIPSLRSVFVGRSEINYSGLKFENINLDEFDKDSAKGYLKSLGLENEKMSMAIYDKFGGNPLTLGLAAELVKDEVFADKNFSDIETGHFLSRISEKNIQEQLVKRNLDHIHEDKVRKIAVPGILVRKIDPDIIKEVLAKPCGLGVIDEKEAKEIYDNLLKESFLITQSEGSITFRQSLRVALYDSIAADSKYNSSSIHDGAVKFYNGKKSPADRAEYLYHRIKRGDGPSIIDKYYDDSLRPYINNSLREFRPDEYLHLARLMNVNVPQDVLDKTSLSEWEKYRKDQIKDLLKNGDETHFNDMKELLAKRTERTPNSVLYYYEAKVCERLGEFSRGMEIIDKALAESEEDGFKKMPLILLKTNLYEYQFDFEMSYKTLVNFNQLFPIAVKSLNRFTKYEFSLVDLQLSIIRISKRISLSSNITKFLPFLFEIINRSNLFDFRKKKKISDILPYPYNAYYERLIIGEEINKIDVFFENAEKSFLTQEEYKERFSIIKKNIINKIDLEKVLWEKYKLRLKDISEPGIFDVNLIDYLKFIEIEEGNQFENLK